MENKEFALRAELFLNEVKASRARRAIARFDPNAIDADGDGIVQEGTPFRRPATLRAGGSMVNSPRPSRQYNPHISKRPRSQEASQEDDLDRIMRAADEFEARRAGRTPQPDRYGQADRPTAPVTRGPQAGSAINPNEQPVTVSTSKLSMGQWTQAVDDFQDYFYENHRTIKPSSKQIALYKLAAAFNAVKVRRGEDGLEIVGPPSALERIRKGLKGLRSDGVDISNLNEIRDVLKESIKSYAFEELETKARFIRRTIGGKPVKRFIRSARFDPNAVDADGDGVVQEGTQFARPAGPKANLRRLATAPQEVAKMDVNDKYFSGVKSVESDLVDKLESDINNFVESQFGKIDTKADLVTAMKAAHPNVIESFEFLNQMQPNTPLNPSQKGLAYGYLYVLARDPKLKNFNIKFKVNKNPHAAGSTGVSSQINDKGKKYDRPMITFMYTVPQNQFSRRAQTMGRSMDNAGNQAIYARLKSYSPDKDPKEALAETDYLSNMLVAVHEGGHASNFASAYDQVFGGKSSDEVKNMLDQIISDQGSRLLGPAKSNMWVDNVMTVMSDIAGTKQRLLMVDGIIQQQISNLSPQQKANAYRAMLKDPMIIQMMGIQFERRSQLVQYIKDLEELETKFEPLFLKSKYSTFTNKLRNGEHPVEVMKADYGLAIEMLDEFMDSLGPNYRKDMETKTFNKAKYSIAFQLSLARNMMDKLTKDEVAEAKSFFLKGSIYGGKDKHSYYANSFIKVPVEGVAELETLGLLGVLDQATPSEVAAIEKLWKWLYGDVSWNMIPSKKVANAPEDESD